MYPAQGGGGGPGGGPNMMQINGQIILEEDYDENYQPTEEGTTF